MYFKVPLPDGTQYMVTNMDDVRYLYYNYYGKDPEITRFFDWHAQVGDGIGNKMKQWQSEMDAYNNNKNPTDAQQQLGLQGITPNAVNENALANANAQYNTQVAQDYSTWQMLNGINAQVQQLTANGLSASGVLQTGAASGNAVGAADTSRGNASTLKQQQVMNQYNQRMSMAKSVIGMAGQMAASGIYGGAIGAAKHGASVLAGAAAHSALRALQSTKQPVVDKPTGEKFKVDENGLLVG